MCIFTYRHTHIYYTHMQKHTQITNIYIYIYILQEFYTLSKLLLNENTQFCFMTLLLEFYVF